MTEPADVLANSDVGGGVAVHPRVQPGAGLTSSVACSAPAIAIAMTFCGFSSIASAGRMLFAVQPRRRRPGQPLAQEGQHALPHAGNRGLPSPSRAGC
jgi:hypothetical protein